MLLFDRSEFDVRVKKTKESMIEKGIDLLIVSHPANMNYLSWLRRMEFLCPSVRFCELRLKRAALDRSRNGRQRSKDDHLSSRRKYFSICGRVCPLFELPPARFCRRYYQIKRLAKKADWCRI